MEETGNQITADSFIKQTYNIFFFVSYDFRVKFLEELDVWSPFLIKKWCVALGQVQHKQLFTDASAVTSRALKQRWPRFVSHLLQLNIISSYGHLSVISTYNPIYSIYNPIYNQL